MDKLNFNYFCFAPNQKDTQILMIQFYSIIFLVVFLRWSFDMNFYRFLGLFNYILVMPFCSTVDNALKQIIPSFMNLTRLTSMPMIIDEHQYP